ARAGNGQSGEREEGKREEPTGDTRDAITSELGGTLNNPRHAEAVVREKGSRDRDPTEAHQQQDSRNRMRTKDDRCQRDHGLVEDQKDVRSLDRKPTPQVAVADAVEHQAGEDERERWNQWGGAG